MATFRSRCTHCGKGLSIKKPELVGKKVACPSCGQPFVVRPIASSRSAPRQARPAKDAVLEAEIDDAGEVGATSGGDDDWLDALDSLPPAAPVAALPAEAPRKRKASRRKKSSSGGNSKKRSSLRDADGEFPLWLHRLLMMGSGFAGGLIATLIWAALIYTLDMPSSWMAILVGVFVGAAVRFGASKWDYGWWPAITASLIACVTILAGKIAGFFLLERQFAAEAEDFTAAYLTMLKHEDYPISLIAMEMEVERLQSGDMSIEDWEAMDDYAEEDDADWSEIYNPERLPEQYPETWEAAKERWKQMPDAEKNERRKAIDEEIALIESGDWDEYEASIGGLDVISVWDFICSIIAIIAAFRIAAGWADDD